MVVALGPLIVFLPSLCAGIHASVFRKECRGGRYALLWKGFAFVNRSDISDENECINNSARPGTEVSPGVSVQLAALHTIPVLACGKFP
jgi:hypothetical protein